MIPWLSTPPCRRTIPKLLSCPFSQDHLTSNLPLPRLDLRNIAENSVAHSHNIFNRNAGASLPVNSPAKVAKLYSQHKEAMSALSAARQERGRHSAAIVERNISDTVRHEIISEASKTKKRIAELEQIANALSNEMIELASRFPNDTHPEVPLGAEGNARVLQQHDGNRGVLKHDAHRDHLRVGNLLGLLDLDAGAKVTGSSWAYLLNGAAKLEQALISHALSTVLDHGFTMVSAPDVIRSDIASRCGFHPREERTASQQSYTLGPSHLDLTLSGTAEIPLAGLHANSTLHLETCPVKLVAFGRAFRMEAGARGKDTRGLYRLHQFSKVEMFTICSRSKSQTAMEEMLAIQTKIMRGLGVPFRVLEMPTEELGASAYRKFDVEAWMPGRGSWGEVCSLSNCTDYQSRRLHIRYRSQSDDDNPPRLLFAHTVNGTAAAIPRLIIALLENGVVLGDQGNGTVDILRIELPSTLKPYWLGKEVLGSNAPIVWI